jgi:hypothetical protein
MIYAPINASTSYSPGDEAGTRGMHAFLRAIYSTLGSSDAVGLAAFPLPHDLDFFGRQEMYAWFNRWLTKKSGGIQEAADEDAPK